MQIQTMIFHHFFRNNARGQKRTNNYFLFAEKYALHLYMLGQLQIKAASKLADHHAHPSHATSSPKSIKWTATFVKLQRFWGLYLFRFYYSCIYVLRGEGQSEMDLSILVAQNACLTKLQYICVSVAQKASTQYLASVKGSVFKVVCKSMMWA